jgi:hypothetical protein
LCPLLVREVQVPRDVLRHKVRALLLEPVR